MIKEELIVIYDRDLNRLKNELDLYRDESKLWIFREEIPNSAGNLALHLIGNLNHFFGAVIAQNGYLRDRHGEFSAQNVAREELFQEIDKAAAIVKNTIAGLTAEDLAKDYPVPFQDRILSTEFVFVYLLSHLNYHLGQINYHRRLLS